MPDPNNPQPKWLKNLSKREREKRFAQIRPEMRDFVENCLVPALLEKWESLSEEEKAAHGSAGDAE